MVDAPPERRRPQCSYSCIQIEHHVVLTPEEILQNLTDAKVFSIGRYRFRRMPFILKIAQEAFQTKMDQTFEGCIGVVGIAEEIAVFGKINEEHDRNMHAMLKRFLDTALKLNPTITL